MDEHYAQYQDGGGVLAWSYLTKGSGDVEWNPHHECENYTAHELDHELTIEDLEDLEL